MGVIEQLKEHILVDGFHVVVDHKRSNGSWIIDKETGKTYLDCYSQFASQPLGWNHPSLVAQKDYIDDVTLHKLANSDMYSEVYRDYVKAFSSIAPDFKYFFFIDGGTLGVENALKAAFDWKCQLSPVHNMSDGKLLDIVHLREAFHGRSGYTLSLTNTGEMKTKWFPKFMWTRVKNPKIGWPVNETEVARDEGVALQEMEWALQRNHVAAIIFEPIQGEGGDNHFRPEFFESVRALADKYEALFILDEVQTGMGLTGKWWAYEHYGVKPDMIAFGKKAQVCGFACTDRIELAEQHVFKQSHRINSTWGGNVVDMARGKAIIEIIKNENLVENAARIGQYFLERLERLNNDTKKISSVRGKGLMLAFDLPDTDQRDHVFQKLQRNMLALKSGTKAIRFRPALTFSHQDVDAAISYITEALS